ncbi:lysophosphatidylcholine acyltransferase-like [Frankliniella occidentalis]|uniref:Lysophosphatidylcholine acyltransferase-like n=1 Tax=Frankliniella occidentalis TaxID=133901 RepID=A0A9C6XB44_FRAOC|nr:lysophosphatidylcholine acyltransferase-like [Frankliniella occidentalis]
METREKLRKDSSGCCLPARCYALLLFQTLLFTVTVLPLRVAAIAVLLVLAWLLACVGLIGLSEEDLRTKPMTGWRKDTKNVLCFLMRGLFAAGGFHRVHIKGRQAAPKDAPVLALAPHSSYFDALPVICLGAPSVVAKGETGHLPFFGRRCGVGSACWAAGRTSGAACP